MHLQYNRLKYEKNRNFLDKMTANIPTARSPLPQFACQSCGTFLQQDSSLETIDDQIAKPIGGK